MCRMIGLVGQDARTLREYLQAFYPLCTRGLVKSNAQPGHRDGWGLAGYRNGEPVYYGRRPHDAADEPNAWRKAILQAGADQGPIVLAHFRKASIGHRSRENTHPFHKKGWLFCHNGTLNQAEGLPLKKYRPEGHTDSERLFLFLLEAIEPARDPAPALKKAFAWIQKNQPHNSLTSLLTDGKTLFACRSYSDQRLAEGETLEERERYYTLWVVGGAGGAVCSEPILKDRMTDWKKLSNGELAILRPGQLLRIEKT
jgi:predicted glutamine amidotransferase